MKERLNRIGTRGSILMTAFNTVMGVVLNAHPENASANFQIPTYITILFAEYGLMGVNGLESTTRAGKLAQVLAPLAGVVIGQLITN